MGRDHQKALVFRGGGRHTECACYLLNGIAINRNGEQCWAGPFVPHGIRMSPSIASPSDLQANKSFVEPDCD